MSSASSDRSGSSSPTMMSTEETTAQANEKMEGLDIPVVEKDTPPETNPGTSSGVTGGIDRLLQKHRNEIMFELRRLQMGDRPVTGEGRKTAVESLLAGASETNPSEDSEHRPENVTVEVNALVERRPVSSVLQSSSFRRNLESALRGAIGNLPSPRRPGSSQATATPNRSETQTRNNNTHTMDDPPLSSPEPRIPPPPPMQVGARPRSGHRTLQSTSPVHSTPVSQSESGLTNDQSHQPELPVAPGPVLAQQWLSHQVSPDANYRHVRELELLEEAQREDFIADISELVQRQLVTSSLEGTFRGHLERLLRVRVESSNLDGERVAQLIQSLPPRRIARNDFSELGINNQELSDDISLISATAAVSVPYAQSNVALSREMAAMKAQLVEMKNLMRMNFDVQLDIQRSIRQEVSAAMSSAIMDMNLENRNDGPSRQFTERSRNQPARESHCLICLDQHVDSVLYQCGHMCVCYCCGMNLRSRGAHCPVCRAPIRDIIRAYKCNADE